MKVIETTKEGATVQLTKDELRLIGSLGIEVFHGAFRQECKFLWDTVAMPVPFKQSGEILDKFHEIVKAVNALSK